MASNKLSKRRQAAEPIVCTTDAFVALLCDLICGHAPFTLHYGIDSEVALHFANGAPKRAQRLAPGVFAGGENQLTYRFKLPDRVRENSLIIEVEAIDRDALELDYEKTLF